MTIQATTLSYAQWHNCSIDWQSTFIRENSMLLGHKAWQGYLTQDRGLVICNLLVCERTYATNYRVCYVPLSLASDYLKKHNLKADAIGRLIDKVRTYCPEQEILVSMERQGKLNVCLLKNLAISPADCYRQVCNRWEEFYQEPRPVGECL